MDDLISRQAAKDALAKLVPYAICDTSTESYTNGLTDAYNLICQLPSAQPEQRWIPCSERLPEKHGESYIVTISDSSVYSAALQWDAHCKRWYLSFLNDDGNILVDFIEDVIAWMPLPEPWKGETNDTGGTSRNLQRMSGT